MPEVMLRRDWPGVFHRTIPDGKKSVRHKFEPGVPVELNAKQIQAVAHDIGFALMPCERDERGKLRVINDEVVTEEGADSGPNTG